jgi:hypothetical protein
MNVNNGEWEALYALDNGLAECSKKLAKQQERQDELIKHLRNQCELSRGTTMAAFVKLILDRFEESQ